MRRIFLGIMFLSMVFLSACEYEVPVVEKHVVDIDPSVLGNWNRIVEGDQSSDYMLVLPLSETEYLIKYQTKGNAAVYFRGYPVKLAQRIAVQVEMIGSDKGPIDSVKRYQLFAYGVKGKILTVSIMNTDLIDRTITNSGHLRKEVLRHRDNKDLFVHQEFYHKLN